MKRQIFLLRKKYFSYFRKPRKRTAAELGEISSSVHEVALPVTEKKLVKHSFAGLVLSTSASEGIQVARCEYSIDFP
jgi:hypothetical protein